MSYESKQDYLRNRARKRRRDERRRKGRRRAELARLFGYEPTHVVARRKPK